MARLEAEKVALERWLRQDPVAVASDALRQAALPGIYGPLGQLFKAPHAYQRLLQRALGERAEYFIAKTIREFLPHAGGFIVGTAFDTSDLGVCFVLSQHWFHHTRNMV